MSCPDNHKHICLSIYSTKSIMCGHYPQKLRIRGGKKIERRRAKNDIQVSPSKSVGGADEIDCKPQTPNPKPQTPKPKAQTPNPKPASGAGPGASHSAGGSTEGGQGRSPPPLPGSRRGASSAQTSQPAPSSSATARMVGGKTLHPKFETLNPEPTTLRTGA